MGMKLWHLERRHDLEDLDNPWVYGFDSYIGFTVRAATEDQARKLATDWSQERWGTEVDPEWGGDLSAWISPKYSTCKELTTDGVAEIILDTFNAS